MKKKKITVVALDPAAGRSYQRDVYELFSEVADIDMYSVMDGSAMGVLPRADLFVVSTDAYGSSEELMRHVPVDSETMAVQASFSWEVLQRLKELPDGEEVLFVNLTRTMAREATAQLEQFGINHVHWVPFGPGDAVPPGVHIAVTPDELRYVPAEIGTVIDVGQRSCTSGMMIEIALRLGFEQVLETRKCQNYFSSMATSNYSFDRMFSRSIRLESQFHILMDVLEEGVIGVNERGEVFACNHLAEEITGVRLDLVQGLRSEKAFPYLPFTQCMTSGERIPTQVMRIRENNISVSIAPVMRQDICIGAFAILQKFNEVEERQNELRGQLLKKGYCAKYSFEDVIGESPILCQTKNTLRKMAASESPVLLIGETGTGKELFAHAVHRTSRRRDKPFIAINVAAFPENLLESELFGYEEGAFTGAKKGGRPGLFECAHRGTLFLDEVEGMSLSLQVKLLRALQEKEVMRVGGNRIIHVDVRIIAATNESLEQKVAEGTFRRDLYYRLNTLPVVIPPLSRRGDDVFLLVEHFRKSLGGDFVLTAPVRSFLSSYAWPGNIRELRNVVEYFIYTDHREITMEDLPPTVFHQNWVSHQEPPSIPSGRNDSLWFVLECLYKASEKNRSLGRDAILKQAKEVHFPLSQQELRGLLHELADAGLARVSRGRGGTSLTPAGRQKWETGHNGMF